MSAQQFGLFFAALLIGYVLVHLRLVRFERYLREIAGLRLLNERLQGVSDSLKRVGVENIEDRMDLVTSELRSIAETASRIERAVLDRVPDAEVQATPGSDIERVRAVIENRLLALGYSNLSILTDLAGMSLEEGGEVTVECDKGQIAHKGKVVLGQGGVRDVRLQNVTQSFP